MTKRILVLDDEEDFARMVYTMLVNQGYEADCFTVPFEAYKSLGGEDYSLVITDYNMPGMDGGEILAEIRRLNPTLPVIIISGYMKKPELVRVANIGVSLVLEKPFDSKDFLACVGHLVSPPEEVEIELDSQETDSVNNVPVQGTESPSGTRIFPSKAHYLSDAGVQSRGFIRSLWRKLDESNLVFVEAPAGSEIELILREVSYWYGYDDCSIHVVNDLARSEDSFLGEMKRVSEDEEWSNVVGVKADIARTAAEFEYLTNRVKAFEAALEGISDLYVIWHIPTDFEATARSRMILEKIVTGRKVTLPPLRNRVVDLAAYATRFAPIFGAVEERSDNLSFTEDAIRCILSYTWPGDFVEFTDTLRRAVMLGTKETIEGPDLTRVIRRAGPFPETNHGEPLLAPFLKNRQSSYLLEILSDSRDENREALSIAGLDPDLNISRSKVADFELIFPEVLNSRPSPEVDSPENSLSESLHSVTTSLTSDSNGAIAAQNDHRD